MKRLLFTLLLALCILPSIATTPIVRDGILYDLETFDNPNNNFWRVIGVQDGFNKTSVCILDTIGRYPVKSIEDLSCASLISIELPRTIINISSGAFADCTNLTSINIPDSLQYIQRGIFKNCI